MMETVRKLNSDYCGCENNWSGKGQELPVSGNLGHYVRDE